MVGEVRVDYGRSQSRVAVKTYHAYFPWAVHGEILNVCTDYGF